MDHKTNSEPPELDRQVRLRGFYRGKELGSDHSTRHPCRIRSGGAPMIRNIYNGPVPRRPRDYYALSQRAWNVRFVYVLNDVYGDAVYVGRSHQPGQRLDRHRTRAWWPKVSTLEIWEVEGRDPSDADDQVAFYEMEAITALRPAHNIVGVI